ncbi:MAG: hypothetical protein ACAI44_35140 [Candidatus Sericytochromatia bacterium]
MKLNKLKMVFSIYLTCVPMALLAGCSGPVPLNQRPAAQPDITQDVYKLLIKDLFNELTSSPEAAELRKLAVQNESQTRDERYQNLKKSTAQSLQLYGRMLAKFRAFGTPAGLEQQHQQIRGLLEDSLQGEAKFEQALRSNRTELLAVLTGKRTEFRTELIEVLKATANAKDKAAVQTLLSLGVRYQLLEPGLINHQIGAFWEKSDADLARALEQTAESSAEALYQLLRSQRDPAPSPVASPSSIPFNPEQEQALFAVIRANAEALNTKNLAAYSATLHPDSQITSYMPNVFNLLVEATTSYKLNKLTVRDFTGTSATVLVARSTTDKSGTIEQEILYSLRQSGPDWKIFQLEVDTQ